MKTGEIMSGKDLGLVEKDQLRQFHGTEKDILTVKVAPAGTIFTDADGNQSKSLFGHVWIEFQGESIGWGLGDSKGVGGAENLTFRDSQAYDAANTSSISYPLYSQSVIGNISNYISDLKSGVFNRDFSSNYNLVTNNCIDFVNSVIRVTHHDNDMHFMDHVLELDELTPNGVEENLEETAEEQKNAETPLVIDMTGEGIHTTLEDGSIYFDHSGDGDSGSTGWIKNNSAFLVWDKNNNGLIDNGNEMFGNNTILQQSGEKAADGFAALADLDSNKDGKFDAEDSFWMSLGLWRDANNNGITDSGELASLHASGIESINLSYYNADIFDANGNLHGQASSVDWNNGSTTSIEDIWFTANHHVVDPMQTEILRGAWTPENKDVELYTA
jgi:hypothetical protein